MLNSSYEMGDMPNGADIFQNKMIFKQIEVKKSFENEMESEKCELKMRMWFES